MEKKKGEGGKVEGNEKEKGKGNEEKERKNVRKEEKKVEEKEKVKQEEKKKNRKNDEKEKKVEGMEKENSYCISLYFLNFLFYPLSRICLFIFSTVQTSSP